MRKRAKRPGVARRLSWRGEALLLQFLTFLAGRLPIAWMDPLASALAATLGRWFPVRRKTLERNLDIALGELPLAEKRRLAREVFRNTILLFCECAKMGRLTQAQIAAAVQTDAAEFERAMRVLESPRGGIFATAHFGNWEWSAAWIAAISGKTFGVVYKPLHNPWADRLLREQRESRSLTVFSTREGIPRALVAFLKNGGKVGMLSDQDARNSGIFLPFFGREASTAPGMGLIAARLGVPMVYGFLERVSACRFRIRLFFPDVPAGDAGKAALALMTGYHAALENVIRGAPGQYFWWHRRWKTRPKTAAPPS